jgi:hypothetical protein
MWTTFVANRVSKIQELTRNARWNHVPSKQNPADLCSRGVSPEKLLQNELWFKGPSFLLEPSDTWPAQKASINIDETPNRRKNNIILTNTIIKDEVSTCKYLNNFSSLQRVFAWVGRFIEKIKKHNNREPESSNVLTTSDLENGNIIIVKIIQHSSFNHEMKEINLHQQTSNKQLIELHPFIKDGTLRVGGRLQNSCLPYEQQHPILLPKNHPVIKSLINFHHFRCHHAGPQALMSILRSKYWIVGMRNMVRKAVSECIKCFKFRPKIASQLMGELPKQRVNPSRPFLNAGVDLCGPVWIRYQEYSRN